MLRFDLYREPFRLLLPDGRPDYRTLAGAFLSLVTIFIVIAFGSYKVQLLLGRDDFKIQRHVEEFLFDQTEQFDISQGFAIAAALTN